MNVMSLFYFIHRTLVVVTVTLYHGPWQGVNITKNKTMRGVNLTASFQPHGIEQRSIIGLGFALLCFLV